MTTPSPAAPASSAAPIGPAPILMILASCCSLQGGAALAMQLFPVIGSWGATALRLGIAAAVLLVIVRPRMLRLGRDRWRAIIAFGLVIGAMNGVFYAALDRIPLGTAVALEFLGPLTVSALLSTRRRDLAWVALALAGVSLFGIESIVGSADLDPLGVALALLAGVFWGLYVMASARVSTLVPGQQGLALAMPIGALLLLPAGAPGVVTGIADAHLLALAAGTAVLSSVLPYSLELAAVRRLPQHVFGILLSLEPAVALVAGVLLVGQEATAPRIAAAVMVVAASVGVTLTARPKAPSPGAETPEVLPTRATVTGEMPALEELWPAETDEGAAPAAATPGEGTAGADAASSLSADAPRAPLG